MSKQISINGRWPIILPDSSADEWIGNMAHHNNSWEMPRLLKLEKYIMEANAEWGRPKIMYIGAYKGDMAALLQTWGADLIVMESTPAFWTLIKETWELNKLAKPLGFWSGLVGRESNLWNGDTGLPGLTEWPTRKAEYIEGHVGFTHLALATGIVPDLITMDVEGSELEILYGGLETIEKHKPAFMLSVHPEFMFHNHGTYERELHNLLEDRNYKGQWLDYDHEHHWWYEVQK